MKKFTLSIILVAAFLTQAKSQHKQGDINLNAGLGLISYFGNGNFGMPPIGASLEYGFKDNISIGGYLAFAASNDTYNHYYYSGIYRYRYTILGPRASFHLNELIPIDDNLDLYGGVFLGVVISSSSWEYTHNNYYSYYGYNPPVQTSSTSTYFRGSLFGGARYRFTDNIGVFGELGYGLSVMQIGLNVKF